MTSFPQFVSWVVLFGGVANVLGADAEITTSLPDSAAAIIVGKPLIPPATETDKTAPPSKANFQVESREVPGGAQLITVFGEIPGVEGGAVPLVSIVRDTRGDGDLDNDQLRQLWVLTSSNPTLLQKAASAIPFFYWRAGFLKNGNGRPKPVLDLSNPEKHVWAALAETAAQVMALDPYGALIRSATRSYRNNARDFRQMHVQEGLAVMSGLEGTAAGNGFLRAPEQLAVEARLSLASQTLGGLVSDARLPQAYLKQRERTTEERGHNWELLRQRAETNGLYFEPFGLNGAPTQALLWVAREDLDSRKPRDFDSQFLSISDPFHDSELKRWKGYTKQQDGKEMIPLALYSLEHPKVPLVLVDFRHANAPRRREMFRHALVDGLSGVAGISVWGNWPLLAGSYTWNFVRARHGAANNRVARIRAYAQAREWLALDLGVDPELRTQLLKRLEALGVNPLEDGIFAQARLARRQYAALQRYSDDPKGLVAQLERDRNRDAMKERHDVAGQLGLTLAHLATVGLYTHWEQHAEHVSSAAR